MRLGTKLRHFFAGLFRRFTAPAVICVLIAGVSIWGASLVYENSDAYREARNLLDRLSGIGWSALCWAVAGCCLRERYVWHWIIGWIAGAAGALLALLLPDASHVWVGLMLAMVCLCFHGISGRDQQALRLSQVFGRFFLCLGLSLVLFIALQVIVGTIPFLFHPDMSAQTQGVIMSCVTYGSFFVAAPWLFLGSVPRADEPAEERSGFRRFSSVVLLPLYLILLAALILYVLKILVTWTMPVGVMNGYALSSLALFVFFHLTLTGEENRLCRWFVRWGGLALIPILISQQIAVWMRYDAYGLTPSRVIGMAVTLLGAAVIVTSLLRRRARWFFIAAAVTAFVVFGSPLNAQTLSRWDQEARLRDALSRNGMLTEAGEITANPDVPQEDRALIYSAVDYLADADAPEGTLTAGLQAQLTRITEEQGGYLLSDSTKHMLLGFRRSDEWHARYLTFMSSVTSSEVDVRGFAHARWIRSEARAAREDAEDKADTSGGENTTPYVLIPCFDIRNVTAGLDATFSADAAHSFPDVPLTFRIDGEEFTLNGLIAASLDTSDTHAVNLRTYSLPEYEISLPSGRVFRVAEIFINDYSDSLYSTDYMTVSGWLLTPEAE